MSSSPPATSVNSPQLKPSEATQNLRKDGIESVLNQPFEPFDRASIIEPADAEASRLSEFEAEFSDMLLSAMLEVRAWALARPTAEQYATEDSLEAKMSEVARTQEEQGRFPLGFLEQTRLRLLQFINSIKSALAALTTSI